MSNYFGKNIEFWIPFVENPKKDAELKKKLDDDVEKFLEAGGKINVCEPEKTVYRPVTRAHASQIMRAENCPDGKSFVTDIKSRDFEY